MKLAGRYSPVTIIFLDFNRVPTHLYTEKFQDDFSGTFQDRLAHTTNTSYIYLHMVLCT